MRAGVKAVARLGIPYKRKIRQHELDFFFNGDLTGYVILTHTPWQLSNLFIRGWKHSELLAGSGVAYAALTTGVEQHSIQKLLKEIDRYVVLKPLFADNGQRNHAVTIGLEMINDNIPYDYDFSVGNKTLYCSEFIWSCYQKAFDGNSPLDKYRDNIIYPQEFYNDKENWEEVFSFQTDREEGVGD